MRLSMSEVFHRLNIVLLNYRFWQGIKARFFCWIFAIVIIFISFLSNPVHVCSEPTLQLWPEVITNNNKTHTVWSAAKHSDAAYFFPRAALSSPGGEVTSVAQLLQLQHSPVLRNRKQNLALMFWDVKTFESWSSVAHNRGTCTSSKSGHTRT